MVWDPTQFAFIEEGSDAPDTVNPSLWRQSQLVLKGGLFKVCERLYQVRNADISNLTIVEGDTGLILMDPLISTEASAAALTLYFQHRPRKDVVAVIHSHSHVDHYGGSRASPPRRTSPRARRGSSRRSASSTPPSRRTCSPGTS